MSEPTYTDLIRENAELRRRLDSVMHAGDMEHARMAALLEACEATAAFIEAYGPESPVAQLLPTFYANLRVYGKNARAAVRAVRPQADALLAELRAARAQLALQPCGHPRVCAVEIEDAGSVCRWCGDRAETELLRRSLAELQTQDAAKVSSA